MANVYNKPIVVIGGGGGSIEGPVDNGAIYEGKYRVRYFDIDGTVLKIEYVANGGITTPPPTPEYDPDYLIFDEWNYDTANYIVDQPTDIGATYKTVGDATYMFCRVTGYSGLSFNLYISGHTSVDWGDGTVDTKTTHTYNAVGDYIIKIYGDISFTTSATGGIFGNTDRNMYLTKAYIYKGITEISVGCFYQCKSMNVVSLPSTITTILDSVFQLASSLNTIILPRNCNTIGSQVFQEGYSLQHIIYNNVGKFPSSCFNECSALKELYINKNVSELGGSCLSYAHSLTDLFVMTDTVPVAGSSMLSSNNKGMVIWVNDSIIEQLKVATNWSKLAAYMKPLSWYPSLTEPNA